MSIRVVYACLFVLTAGGLVPGALVGQDTPAEQSGDSLALAFEREVFAYPEYERRNPFGTLLSADSGGLSSANQSGCPVARVEETTPGAAVDAAGRPGVLSMSGRSYFPS